MRRLGIIPAHLSAIKPSIAVFPRPNHVARALAKDGPPVKKVRVELWLDERDLRGNLDVDQHLRAALHLLVEGCLLGGQHLAEV